MIQRKQHYRSEELQRLSICKKLSFLHFADTQRSVYSTFLCCKQIFATECCTRSTSRFRLAFGDFRAPWLFLWGCGRIVLQWLTKFFSCDLSLLLARLRLACVSTVQAFAELLSIQFRFIKNHVQFCCRNCLAVSTTMSKCFFAVP